MASSLPLKLLLLLSLLLSACGGGGGDSSRNDTINPQDTLQDTLARDLGTDALDLDLTQVEQDLLRDTTPDNEEPLLDTWEILADTGEDTLQDTGEDTLQDTLQDTWADTRDLSEDTLDTWIDGGTVMHLDWPEGCNPFSLTNACILPYPSLFYEVDEAQSPTGVRLAYPADAIAVGPGLPGLNMDATNAGDGVSPAGPILLHFGKDVDPEQLAGVHVLEKSLAAASPLALFNRVSGERVPFLSEMDMNRKNNFPNRYVLIVRPMEPMEMGQRHIMALTRDLVDTEGEPLESPAAFVALRDNIPTDNPLIEEVRPRFEEIFEFLAERGYAREDLLLAWDFSVASKDYLLGSVLSMREEALEEVGGTGLAYEITEIQENPNANVARLVKGNFEVPTFLTEENTFDYDQDHHPIRQPLNQSFPFTLVIPKKAETLQEPLPLVIFGHGIFGSGRSYLAGWGAQYTQPFAEQLGVILVATDWIGLSSGDQDLIIEEVMTDLNRIALVTDRLQQSLINNLTLTELTLGTLAEDPSIALGDWDLIDADRVYYYGVSLGGIQGSSFVSLSNRISRGVLAVPGSVWLNMIPRSTVWNPIKMVMDFMYPDPLVQQLGIAVMQTWFDNSDPINLTRLMFKDPLPDAPVNRRFIFQESIGDSQVPNMTTEMLARAVGVPLLTPGIYNVFGLEEVTSPAQSSCLVQYYLKDQADANFPPEENVPPASDNNVHADMVFQPNVTQQVIQFLSTGEVVQFCEDSCDPN